MTTRAQAIEAAGRILAASRAACAQMTPREQAQAAWTPTSPYSVDQLEDLIREQRSLRARFVGGTPEGGGHDD